ncbi:MAG: dehydrogenase [Gemmataceae bacterium]
MFVRRYRLPSVQAVRSLADGCAREAIAMHGPVRLPLICAITCLYLIGGDAELVLAQQVIAAQRYRVGAARVDVTPDYPVRLNGYGFRRNESEGVTARIYARALVIDDGHPAVLVNVDNCAVSREFVERVFREIHKAWGIPRERCALTVTHTHTAPMVRGVLTTIFGMPIPPEHQRRIDRYSAELEKRLVEVVGQALERRRTAYLSWGIGSVGFAANRRTKNGPVDHDLPVLFARDTSGKTIAVLTTYACHATTLWHNKISGDWPGYAQELIETDFHGCVALVTIGCGADANPIERFGGDRPDLALRYGAQIAAEVKRLSGQYLAPVQGQMACQYRDMELPLEPLPSRAEWQERAKRNDPIGYHARVQLERLERGQMLPRAIPYSIQSWCFGSSLAFVFLPGEVVVDYSLRLKKELDRLRVWIQAYANGVPCYIASERILREGGYEGGGAMVYYDWPARMRPGVEELIVREVHRQLGERFASPWDRTRPTETPPLSAQQSLARLQTLPGYEVELVAAEPLVVDPVAIHWGPDGRLWVCEMHDYPEGIDGKYAPGGRIRLLEDTDGDGRWDRATLFADRLPFPTGLLPWQQGVLICAAPDILYAEDADADGRAERIEKVYSGFATHNYQARVNSLEYGLDGWIYGACGLFGGATIRSYASGGSVFALGDRDFRIRPADGAIEAATGRSQQGRVRDDWDHWYGCDNSVLGRQYVLPEHYVRRNPYLAGVETTVYLPMDDEAARLYWASPLQLFRLSGPPGRATAACGLGVYRDIYLGSALNSDVFVCEPVHHIVHHMHIVRQGFVRRGIRLEVEKEKEFLQSSDPWFRPVQVRTGPDGCLYVVDMYRYAIEHPRWIPPEDLAKLDVRAGCTLGRIYRLKKSGSPPPPVPRLDKSKGTTLAQALDTANGPVRDMVMQLILWRRDREALAHLEKLAAQAPLPETRLYALCTLAVADQLDAELLRKALQDAHPAVRRHALRLAEKHLRDKKKEWIAPVKRLASDQDPDVLLQFVLSIGEYPGPDFIPEWLSLVRQYGTDPYFATAALSSLHDGNVGQALQLVVAEYGKADGDGLPVSFSIRFGALLGAMPVEYSTASLPRLCDTFRGRPTGAAAALLSGWAGSMRARPARWAQLPDAVRQAYRSAAAQARHSLGSQQPDVAEQAAGMLGLVREDWAEDIRVLSGLLSPRNAPALRRQALEVLLKMPDQRAAHAVFAAWSGYTYDEQQRALELICADRVWLGFLLEALEQGQVPSGTVDVKRRERLFDHPDARVRERARRLWGHVPRSDRARVLEQYQAALALAGKPEKGKLVYQRVCSSCHVFRGEGKWVGPPLDTTVNKTPAYFLQEILDPNRNVDPQYTEYVVETVSGLVYSGVLDSQSAQAIRLRSQNGAIHEILRRDIEQFRSTGKSLMPEGLEKELTLQDMADLIAYLQSKDSASGQR